MCIQQLIAPFDILNEVCVLSLRVEVICIFMRLALILIISLSKQ
jgi:hypothetical protein